MNSDNTTGIDDNEVNQMIAGMGGGTPVQPQSIVGHTTGMASVPQPTDMDMPQQSVPIPTVPTIVPGAPQVAAPVPVAQPQPAPVPQPVVPDPVPLTEPDTKPTTITDLDEIKHEAVEELRPLVEKLDLPADERFDTLLLIIRSTDDSSLVPQAYDAARAIPDETRRAQALLDIIKEIDYFGHSKNV